MHGTGVTTKSKGNKPRQIKQWGAKVKADIGPLKKRCITTAYSKNGNHKDELNFKKHSRKYIHKYPVRHVDKIKALQSTQKNNTNFIATGLHFAKNRNSTQNTADKCIYLWQ